MKILVLTALVLVAVAPLAEAQTTWYVDASNIPPGTGTESDPYVTIQAAIDNDEALDGDTVLVLEGTYTELVDLAGKSLALEAVDGPGLTVIDAGSAGSCVRVASGEGPATVLRGFTLTGGSGTPTGPQNQPSGGGVFLSGSHLTLENCIVTANDSAPLLGGGLYSASSYLTVIDCTFSANSGDNQGQRGAGIHAVDSEVQIFDSRFDAHVGDQLPAGKLGGGIYAESCTLVIQDCEFTGNTATFGGGLFLRDSTTTLVGSCVEANEAFLGAGAGLYVEGGMASILDSDLSWNYASNASAGAIQASESATVLIQDCGFAWNYAEWSAGAIAADPGSAIYASRATLEWNSAGIGGAGAVWCIPGSTVELDRCLLRHNATLSTALGGNGGALHGPALLDRCTLVENTAAGAGGAAFGATLRNSILWNNDPDSLAGPVVANYCDIEGGWPGTGNIDSNPLFWPFASMPMLRGASPCIDAGAPDSPTDPDGSPPDLGAFWHDVGLIPPPTRFCDPFGDDSGCVPRIGWSGTAASNSTLGFELHSEGLPTGQIGFMIWSIEGRVLPYLGPGSSCLPLPYQRTALASTGVGDGSACSGVLVLPKAAQFLQARGVPVGEPVYAQFLYRTPGGNLGSTDALVFGIGEERVLEK